MSRSVQFGTTVATDIGSISFDDLPARDATVVTEVANAESGRRLPEIVADIGPIDPQRPLAGLESCWAWLMDRLPDTLPRDAQQSWAAVDKSDVPYWCWFRNGSGLFRPFGPGICCDIAAVDAYVIATLLAAQPGARLMRSTTRANHNHYRRPVVALPNGSELLVSGRGVGRVHRIYDDDTTWRQRSASPEDFSSALSSWVQPVVTDEIRATCPISVAAAARAGFDFVVEIDDITAHEHSDDVDELVRLIAALDHVDRAHREDREIILIRAGALTVGSAEHLIVNLWNELQK